MYRFYSCQGSGLILLIVHDSLLHVIGWILKASDGSHLSPSSIILLHEIIPSDVSRKVTWDTLDPSWDLKRRWVAPRFNRKFLFNCASKAIWPTLTREGGTSTSNEIGVYEMCSTAEVTLVPWRYVRRGREGNQEDVQSHVICNFESLRTKNIEKVHKGFDYMEAHTEKCWEL